MPPDTEYSLNLTLTVADWKLISFLANRGALEMLQQYIEKGIHDMHCLEEAARVCKRLQEAVVMLDPSLAAKAPDAQPKE